MYPKSLTSSTPVPGVDDIMKMAKEHDVKLIRLQFVDIHGRPKNMSIHVAQLDKALNNEIMLDGSSIAGFRTIETSDMYFFPDRRTFKVLPWVEGSRRVARIVCDMYNADQTPFEGCPRNNLKRVLAEVESKLGYTYNVGPELEFFLFKKNHDGTITMDTHDSAGYYDLGPDDMGEVVRSEIVETLENLGFDMEADHHEVAQGQHEIDFKYADALMTADNVLTVKIISRIIAARHGLHCTFMPKPIYGVNGSGMHCNMSLGDKAGNNVFFDENGEYQLSTEAHHFIGGILKHIRGVTAITNPLVNSYKRLVPGYEAPVYTAWSPANRSALLRVPAKRGKSTRIELRSPDPSTNPYLAFATLLQAGIDGIENKIEPPKPAEVNIYNLSEEERAARKIEPLPGSLYEALAELKTSPIAKKALGDHIYNEFIATKEREWKSFSVNVSPWELETYMRMH
ncbi:MAG: type I glutamate--ammonia ligase [Cyanobacteria bacterium HKST-UBA06]|nr:type I glutamate--ammonia ligase [Cyanobacteria bacterium HKST-UBA04]MCA9806510.1 type I glutamate--ammonia ligase [Cyanobacteria bacterium HKST-UBA06]MCA9841332.1 type I glutamate--ammonia ligase [Cyanobacteria bacterium HKST-UBA03]